MVALKKHDENNVEICSDADEYMVLQKIIDFSSKNFSGLELEYEGYDFDEILELSNKFKSLSAPSIILPVREAQEFISSVSACKDETIEGVSPQALDKIISDISNFSIRDNFYNQKKHQEADVQQNNSLE